MFPESNAPKPSQPWVRDVIERTYKVQSAAALSESNAYALAGSSKSSLALISDRINNIDTFTTGLFEQARQVDSHNSYAALDDLPVLYEYTSGDFRVVAGTTKRIPFAAYNELTVTADGVFNGWTTSGTATGIDVTSLIPMVMATIPPMARMSADGVFTDNAFTYASRWTVENFEPFLDFNIPSNVVPTAPSSSFTSSVDPGYHPEFSASTQVRYFKDNYSGYSMRYTREWLTTYMEAIRDYTMENSPPAAGSFYYPPDVDRIEIVLGYYFREYTGAATNTLYLNDSRLSFVTGNTFSVEGIRNVGY